MCPKWIRVCACEVLLILAVTTQTAMASPIELPSVHFTSVDLNGGLFQYDFMIQAGPVPIVGLLILHGNSAFGLDAFSAIGAPQDVGGDPFADWDFFAPLPALVDSLDYFSLNPAGDVPAGGSLGGFTFVSMRNPATLTAPELEVIVVGSDDSQVRRTAIPEPSTVILFGLGILGLFGYRWRRYIECLPLEGAGEQSRRGFGEPRSGFLR